MLNWMMLLLFLFISSSFMFLVKTGDDYYSLLYTFSIYFFSSFCFSIFFSFFSFLLSRVIFISSSLFLTLYILYLSYDSLYRISSKEEMPMIVRIDYICLHTKRNGGLIWKFNVCKITSSYVIMGFYGSLESISRLMSLSRLSNNAVLN